MRMKNNTTCIITTACLSLILLSGCMRMALRSSSAVYRNFSEAIFEECDPELARTAIPADLKIMEGLLKSDPDNRHILRLLSMGYCGYALLFVEEEDPIRASALYLRARDYGRRALGDKGFVFSRQKLNPEALKEVLPEMGPAELEALFWFTLSWNGWINLNLDRPAALGQLSLAQACLERIMAIDPGYFHGLPCVLMGVLYSARPQMLGGDIDRAEFYFKKALELSRHEFFLVQYYCARHYAVRIQDREMFNRLLEEIEQGDPRALKGACLINQVIQARGKELRRLADDLFL